MIIQSNNPCIRCGKQRVTSSERSENVKTFAGVSVVTYTQTVCPDAVCQNIVESKQLAMREDAIERTRIKSERAENEKKLRAVK